MKLTPHYSGLFEAFRHDGKQFGRLQLSGGSYVWFTFDFFTESYQSMDNELNTDNNLQHKLENSYKEYIQAKKSKVSPF
jgi:hypothetical protein